MAVMLIEREKMNTIEFSIFIKIIFNPLGKRAYINCQIKFKETLPSFKLKMSKTEVRRKAEQANYMAVQCIFSDSIPGGVPCIRCSGTCR